MKPWGYIAITLMLAVLVGIAYRKLMRAKFQWPVKGRITTPFGPRIHPITGAEQLHNGIDIAVPIGTDVLAPADGVVKSVYSTTAGGRQIVLEHDGWMTGYAHLSQQLVSIGDHVAQGQVIAKSGNTGTSTGPHLHFTMTNGMGQKVDPIEHLA